MAIRWVPVRGATEGIRFCSCNSPARLDKVPWYTSGFQ